MMDDEELTILAVENTPVPVVFVGSHLEQTNPSSRLCHRPIDALPSFEVLFARMDLMGRVGRLAILGSNRGTERPMLTTKDSWHSLSLLTNTVYFCGSSSLLSC